MFGIELKELFLLFKQLGFVLAGGAALWGFVFSIRDFKCGKRECLIHDWLAARLYPLLLAGGFIGILFHQILMVIIPASAHEGIVIFPTSAEIYGALLISDPLVLMTGAFLLFSLFLRIFGHKIFFKILSPFYFFSFIIFFLLSSATAWTGGISSPQAFFTAHGFHSIFTLGTVLILDYLIILSRKSVHLKEHLYPVFPTISKVIWAGLAVDFGSTLLIFNEFTATPKFLFMQTVIGILIINGIFLSGPITRKLFKGEKHKRGGFWQKAVSLSGVVSAASWLTITTVDFFAGLTLGYGTLLAVYLSIIILVFILHQVVEHFENKRKSPTFIH